MANSRAAILVGRRPDLSREIWSGFVNSGLVEYVLNFNSVDELLESIDSPSRSVDVTIKIVFFALEHIEDLSLPEELRTNQALSNAPLIAAYSPGLDITSTDIRTLYDRGVKSVIGLPIKFQDLGRLVLQMETHWSGSTLPQCTLPLPNEKIFLPDKAS